MNMHNTGVKRTDHISRRFTIYNVDDVGKFLKQNIAIIISAIKKSVKHLPRIHNIAYVCL